MLKLKKKKDNKKICAGLVMRIGPVSIDVPGRKNKKRISAINVLNEHDQFINSVGKCVFSYSKKHEKYSIRKLLVYINNDNGEGLFELVLQQPVIITDQKQGLMPEFIPKPYREIKEVAHAIVSKIIPIDIDTLDLKVLSTGENVKEIIRKKAFRECLFSL